MPKVKHLKKKRTNLQAVQPKEEGQDTEQAQRLDSDDERDKNRELFSAIHKSNLDEVVGLLYSGVKVNIIDANNKNNTPLHYAIEKGNKQIVEKLLLQKGINVNAENSAGDTPLHIATRKGNKELVQLLNNAKQPSTSKKKKEQQMQQKRSRLTKPTAQVSTGVTTPLDEISQPKETDQCHSKLSCALHGNIYQLKLLMIFFKRGLAAEYSFRLATEWDAAESFDDLVFQFTDSNKKDVYYFLQAKHKQDELKKISVGDLLSEKDDFSLKKYFISYRKIKQKPKFNKYELKDFVICTNIDLHDHLQNNFESVQGEDKILDIKVQNEMKQPKRLKFKIHDSLLERWLTSIFHEASDIKMLAKKLAICVWIDNNKGGDLTDGHFKKYHVALAEKVLKTEDKRQTFKSDFINSEVSEEVKKFRKTLFDESNELLFKEKLKKEGPKIYDTADLENNELFRNYHLSTEVINTKTKTFENDFIKGSPKLNEDVKKFRKLLLDKNKLSESDFKKKLQEKSFQISDTFGDVLKIKETPSVIITEYKPFVNMIVPLIEKQITDGIIHKVPEHPIMKQLVGHVFVEAKVKTIKFRRWFMNDENLHKNLEDFRKALKTNLSAKKIQFSQLYQCEFKYDTHICTEEDYEKLMNNEDPYVLPNDYEKMMSNEINEFLEKLVFAVNQPNECELGKIIEAEMGEGINLFDGKFAASNFQEYMLDWMKAKEGCFLTHIDGENFFKEAKQKISKLVVIGPTEDYHAKVKDIGILYSEDRTEELRSFLNSNDKQIFNLIISDTMLGSIKVHQTIKSITEKYQKDDSHIFMCLSSVLRIQHRVISTFKSSTTNNLLAIVCDPVEKDTKKLYHHLRAIIDSNKNKKIVLITQIDNGFAKQFKDNLPDKYEEKKDENHSFIDLTIESRKKLSNEKKVIFQGDEVNLGTLIDDKSEDLIDAEILSKLVNNEEIAIGKKPDDVKDYYIDRIFNRHIIKINEGFKKEFKFFVIDKDNVTESNLQQDQDIVLISDLPEDFKKLCNKYQEYNIHWLTMKIKKRQEEFTWQQFRGVLSKLRNRAVTKEQSIQEDKPDEVKEFTWQQSRGVLSKLRDFVDTKEQSIQEYKPDEVTDKLVIIAGEPGMGKSTLLSRLKSDSSLWVVRINLVDQSNQLSKWKDNSTKISESETAKFLYGAMDFQIFRENEEEEKDKMIINILELVENNKEQTLIKGLNRFEVRLFYNFFKNGKIALMFDGFDEISPDYNSQVIELLEFLKGTNTEKIWITIRPYNILIELEDKLGTFSYALKPLITEEQKSFLNKFWGKKLELSELDEQRFKIFIDELLHQFSKSINDPERTFVGIPLHIYMIAEVFSDEFKKFYSSGNQTLSDKYKNALSEKLNLVTLYEDFFDTKLYEELKKENSEFDKSKPRTKRLFTETRDKFIKDHKKLAVYALFEKDKLEKVLSEQEIKEVHALVDNINKGEEKTGIIDRIINGKPNFTHRTFAEYLAAKYLWDKFKSIESEEFEKDFVDAIIINNLIDEDMIQICKFCQLVTQEDLENNAVFSNKESKLETLFIKLVSKTHVRGPFEFKNSKQSTKLLLKIIEFSLLEENEQKFIKNVQGLEMCKKVALLSVSAEMGYIKLAKYLIFGTNDLKEYLSRDEWSFSPLWFAVKNDHFDIIKLLLDNKVNLGIQDEWKRTPLHLERHLEIINLLLDNGADPNIQDDCKRTPLYLAAENGHLGIVKLLLDNKADPNIQEQKNQIPLHLAAEKGHLDIVKLLLAQGVDPNIQDDRKRTPLHLAAEKGHLDIIKLLLAQGVDPNIQDYWKRTPLELVEDQPQQNPQINQEIINVLKSIQQENRPISQVVAEECLPSTSHKSGKK